MKPIRTVETQIVYSFSVSSPRSVVICLHDSLVFAQEFEVNFVLGLVAFERGQIDVEVEAAGVAFGALDEGAKGAVLETGGGAPPRAAAVVKGEGDGGGFRGMGA